MLQQLSDESEKAGLKMNLSKTKIMTNAEPTDLDTVRVNNEEIEKKRKVDQTNNSGIKGNKRSKGRQHKRWEDDIKQTAGAKWTRIARDRETWKSLEEAFVAGQAVTSNNPIADVIILRTAGGPSLESMILNRYFLRPREAAAPDLRAASFQSFVSPPAARRATAFKPHSFLTSTAGSPPPRLTSAQSSRPSPAVYESSSRRPALMRLTQICIILSRY
ncbi:hypothetical protein EVAR_8793_1 [Eumeta japonica]|uniref:Reverse transcriptase domain-containing protein n=1 Tax=Eumeta variegata TaxID=151549 RepID=A0A4C1TUH1_EUMVA|nr:hypothetical protein EVAR_8793_1 [Eumeta japonica]